VVVFELSRWYSWRFNFPGRDALTVLADVSKDGNTFIVRQSTSVLNTDDEGTTICRNMRSCLPQKLKGTSQETCICKWNAFCGAQSVSVCVIRVLVGVQWTLTCSGVISPDSYCGEPGSLLT